MESELEKYLKPVVILIDEKLSDQNLKYEEKKKLMMLREFVKEQLPNENSDHTAR